jgi:hypothetical protein
LKLDTFAAMPAMNAASRPVTATPRAPSGRYLSISAGIASLYCSPLASVPMPGSRTRAAMPGSTVISGTIAFG